MVIILHLLHHLPLFCLHTPTRTEPDPLRGRWGEGGLRGEAAGGDHTPAVREQQEEGVHVGVRKLAPVSVRTL